MTKAPALIFAPLLALTCALLSTLQPPAAFAQDLTALTERAEQGDAKAQAVRACVAREYKGC